MPDFNEVVDQTCVAAGADFAFVLTRKGRLVTLNAPRDMPAPGRKRLVEAALVRGAGSIAHLEMPRQDLVPYGGAAPVDVYVGVASEQAILCLVVPTWAERFRILPALDDGLRGLEELIRSGDRAGRRTPVKRAPSRPRLTSGASGPDEPASRPRAQLDTAPSIQSAPAAPAAPPEKPTPPPPPSRRRGAMAGLMSLAVGAAVPAKLVTHHPVIKEAPARPAPQGSLPEIRIGEATLGRESLAAIARELSGEHPSLPLISVGVATVGRETLAAIESDERSAARAGSAPEAFRVELASISPESRRQIAVEEAKQAADAPRISRPVIKPMRATQPWVESAADAKRAADAARRARNVPPDMLLGLVEAETDVLELGLADLLEPDPEGEFGS